LVDPDIIKYLIQKLEDKILANPLSPEFVKLGNYYLINGNTTEAINLLKAGLEFYPEYPTARLLMGKAYLAGRYFLDAKKIFEQLINEYPDMAVARKYVDIASDMAKKEVSRKYDEDIIPKLEFKAPEFNDYDFNFNLFPSYEIEEFAGKGINLDSLDETNEFKDFKNVFDSPHFFKKRSETKPKFEKKRLKNKFEVKIITETLADIFARQGNYFDAIEAYTYLLKIKPERKEALESKISEVEMQINKLINDF
jgi:tetratricopeptide (TPR) repeat protein